MHVAGCPHKREHGQRKVWTSQARTMYSFAVREQAEPSHQPVHALAFVGCQRRARVWTSKTSKCNRGIETQTQTRLGRPRGNRHSQSIDMTVSDCIAVVARVIITQDTSHATQHTERAHR